MFTFDIGFGWCRATGPKLQLYSGLKNIPNSRKLFTVHFLKTIIGKTT